ncbi:uncharacterized protein LOC143863410 [Tasmannia lanceolata]|uniref:uncharacterized protein LOC143863410 n=1 Tax=Tasmannia lanceolata TaxID=3420 RepID=UPI00406368A8
MTGFSKLVIGLTFVFSIFTVALIAGLCYLLRRKFLRENTETEEISGEPYNNPSKEPLYFFCWKTQSQVDPTGAPVIFPDSGQCVVGDRMKWEGLGGPSRVLFTIEEGIEDLESEEEKSQNESFNDIEKEISFVSPCSSPPLYTPMSSPTRVEEKNNESDRFSFCISVAED